MMLKAQGAMEFLMTYGWGFIAITVALAVLYQLGVFGSISPSNICVGTPGYLCNSLVFLHSSGNVMVLLGQNTGATLYNANIAFVPQAEPRIGGIPDVLVPGSSAKYNSIGVPFRSGQSYTLTLPTTVGPTSVGTPLMGTIWISYTSTQSSNVLFYAQIATVTTRAK